MSENIKNSLRYICIILSVITGVSGIYILTVWYRVLSPDIYIDAFRSSGLYREVTNVIEAQATHYLQVEGKRIVEAIIIEDEQLAEEERTNKLIDRNLAVWFINTIIDNRTAGVVSAISEQIGLEQGIQDFTESSITRSINWISKESTAPAVFSHIPSVEELEAINEDGLIRKGLTGVIYNAFGFNELPTCSGNNEEREALVLIAGGTWREIRCTSGRVDEAVKEQIAGLVPENSLNNLQNRLDERFDMYRLESLSQGVNNLVLNISMLKEELLANREIIHNVRTFAFGLVIVSVVFAILSYFLSPKKSIKTVFKIGFVTGIILIILSTVFHFIISNRIVEFLNLSRFTLNSEAISTAQAMLLEDSLHQSAVYISRHIHDYPIQVGAVLAVVFGLGLLIVTFFERDGKKKVMLWLDNIESRVKRGNA